MSDHQFYCLQAPERLKFALRKIEDMQDLEVVDLSGATTLSRVPSDLRSIQNMLAQILHSLMNPQAYLEDIKETDPNFENCLEELGDVGICIEVNIFNFLETVAEKIKPGWVPDSLKNMDAKFVDFISINNLMVGVHNIKSRVERIKIEDLGVPSDRAITEPARQSLRDVDDIRLSILEPHRKCILQRLIAQSLQIRSLVLVGTSEIANTVLLEKIYQSTEVKTHFEECFWLFPRLLTNRHPDDVISMYEPIDILRKMLLKLGDTDLFDAHDEDNIMSRLHQSLSRKRCLVVLDNNSFELCTLVNVAFPDGKNGSRLLITTDKRRTIKLFKDLGEDILELEDDRTLLKLEACGSRDFYEIPSVLKMCLVYTATVFPCGSVILADSLIRLWILEGIIPHEEETTMENIAESYLEQLLQRGFLRIFRAYYHNQANHPIRSIMLHPHLHFGVSRRAHKERFPSYPDFHIPVTFPVSAIGSVDYMNKSFFSQNQKNLRRLAFHLPYQFNQIFFFEKGQNVKCIHYPSLHSLFFFNFAAPVASSPFTFVRVLAVFSSHIRFPKEYTPCWLDELINLRFLGFIVCLVEGGSLGKTLNRLVKLETLDLSESFVSGLSEFIKNNKKVNVVGPVKEELPESWSPIPDMFQ